MSKKVKNPGKAPRVYQAAPAMATLDQEDRLFSNTRLQGLIVFALAFLLYANTLGHGFVLDDSIVITENMFTQKGASGIPGILSKDTFFGFFKVEGKDALVSGGRYRPFTLVIFALLYQVAGKSAFAFHLLTVLLFAATCLALYHTLRVLVTPKMGVGYGTAMAFIAAALFAVHPIHTEVVANIKGCDEILTLLGCLGVLWLILKAVDTGKTAYGLAAGAVFFLACMSKENAATFVVIIPLALWFFRPDVGAAGIVRQVWPAWAGFAVFFLIRGSILNWKFGSAPLELMNNPYLKIVGNQWVSFAFSEKLATIFYTLGKYLQLLVWPHPLTHDYYPRHIDLKTFSDPVALLSLVAYSGLAVYALTGIRKKDPVRFGILFYLLTLSIVSNLVFPVGTHMGERFAFMPSVGFCLVAAHLLLQLARKKSAWGVAALSLPLGATGFIALVFSGLTILRNPAWESNEKLFLTDVKTSGNSAKIQNACGGVLFEKAMAAKDTSERRRIFEQVLVHAGKAVELYPNYKDALISRAGARYYLNDYDGAVSDYRQAIRVASNDAKIPGYLAVALRDAGQYYGEQRGDLAKAMQYLTESWQVNNQDASTARLLGVANGVQGGQAAQAGRAAEAARYNAEALTWFKKAAELSPKDASILFDLGTAYILAGDAAAGNEWHKKALEVDPQVLEKRRK